MQPAWKIGIQQLYCLHIDPCLMIIDCSQYPKSESTRCFVPMTEETRQSVEGIRPINQNFTSNISCQLSHTYIKLIMTRNSLTIFEMKHYIFLIKISQNNNRLPTDLPLLTYRLYEIPLHPVY